MLMVDDLKKVIATGNASVIAEYMKKHKLEIRDNKITASQTECNMMEAYWDKRQLVKKINLNSLNLGRVYQ